MLELLKEFKNYVGFSDYDIILGEEKCKSMQEIANVFVDRFEKEVTITLGYKFNYLSKEKQRNTLIHELIHGRVQLYRNNIDLLRMDEEEQMVNDLTRGLERLK